VTPIQQNTKLILYGVYLVGAAVICVLVGIGHTPEGTTITNEAISTYLFKTGQRIVTRSNMTETVVQNASIATILELTLEKEHVIGDGVDSCRVTATVYDAAGQLVPDGQPVAFTTSNGSLSNGTDTAYTITAQGHATTWLRSDIVQGQAVLAQVGAITFGASGRPLTKHLPVLFYAGGVQGRIISSGQMPVLEPIVIAYDASGREVERDTTGNDGSFFIPINQSGDYTIDLRYRNVFDDEVVLSAHASVQVPATGGVAAISPLNVVSGILVDAETGQPVRQAGIPVLLSPTGSDNPNAGRVLPAVELTDERGLFAFDSLAPGFFEVSVVDARLGGKHTVQATDGGTFVINANILVLDAPTFEITKSSNKRIAEIGDIVSYSVEIRNSNATATLQNVTVMDELPFSFVYAKGSARRDGEPLPEPLRNRKLEWLLADSLPPGGIIRLSYAVIVGSAALESNGINQAYAWAVLAGDTVRTAVATVQVVVRPGLFTDRGVIIGKVFYDLDENGQQDEGEQGISGVELLMEDGTRVITGDDGKYSLPEVRPGQHVLRVDQSSLPVGSRLLAPHSEFAQDGISRFVRLTDGGIVRSDFYVQRPDQAALDVISAQTAGPSIATLYVLKFHDIGTPTRVSVIDTLPDGFQFDLKSIMWRNVKLFPQGEYARTLWVDLPTKVEQSNDSISFSIVADSSVVNTRVATNSKLVLAYARGKDAVFAGRHRYATSEDIQPVQPASLDVTDTSEVIRETEDTLQVHIEQKMVEEIQPARDTVVQRQEVVDTAKRVVNETKKQPKKKSSSRKVKIEKEQTQEPVKVEPTEPGTPLPDPGPLPEMERHRGITPIPTPVALGVIGLLAVLIIAFALRRRRN
jgi:uncharacterized repeat protein (TIGR01451 family)